jgi:hypothetical protein
MESARVVVAITIACGACAGIPKPTQEAQRPRAVVDQGVATFSYPEICSFVLHAGAATRTVVLPDRPYQAFNGRTELLAVTPLPPGHYVISAVTAGKPIGPIETDYYVNSYTDCSSRRATRPVHIEFDVAANAVTLLSLPEGPIDLVRSFTLSFDREASGREAAWLPAIEDAKRTLRAKLIAARRESHEGYDVYRDCGWILPAVAVVRMEGRPLPLSEKPADPLAVREADAKASAAIPAASYLAGTGEPCVDKHHVSITVVDEAHLEEAVREAAAWLVHDDIRGEVTIEVEIPDQIHDL